MALPKVDMQRHQFSQYWTVPSVLLPDHQDDFCLFGRWACTAPHGIIYCMDCRGRRIVGLDLVRRHLTVVAIIPDHYTAQYLACDMNGFIWLELVAISSERDNYIAQVNPATQTIEFKFNITRHCQATQQYIMDLFNDSTHHLWVTVNDSLCRFDDDRLIPVKTYPSNMMIYYRLRTDHILVGVYSETFRMAADPYKIILLSPNGQEIFAQTQVHEMCLNIKIMEVPRDDDVAEIYLITTSYPGYNGEWCQLHRLTVTRFNHVTWETVIPSIRPRIRACDYLPHYQSIIGFRQHEVIICPVKSNYIPSLTELCLNQVYQLKLPRDVLTQDLQEILNLRQV